MFVDFGGFFVCCMIRCLVCVLCFWRGRGSVVKDEGIAEQVKMCFRIGLRAFGGFWASGNIVALGFYIRSEGQR